MKIRFSLLRTNIRSHLLSQSHLWLLVKDVSINENTAAIAQYRYQITQHLDAVCIAPVVHDKPE